MEEEFIKSLMRVKERIRQIRMDAIRRVYSDFMRTIRADTQVIFNGERLFIGFTWDVDVVEFLRVRGYYQDKIASYVNQTVDRRIGLYLLFAFTKKVIPLPRELGKNLMEFLVVL
jgi:hypothetical protein